MPKNIEDIIPGGRRSIKSIPIPIRKTASPVEPAPIERIRPEPVEDFEPRRHSKKSKKNIWIGGVVGILVLSLVIFSLISSATLSYTPKTTSLTFKSDTYVAYQSAENGQLAYSIIKLSGQKSVSAPASGEETASDKASGSIVVYNEQSNTQKLVKTTRFETSDGLIFRTPTDITIPAKGNVEVTVVADQPGTTYNIGLSDFTIPGFKGTPNFDKVYARSKTPMSGGFVGTRKKVSDADLAKAKTTLDAGLQSDLLTQARAQMPADFVLFPNLASLSYSLLPQGTSTDSSATVSETGNIVAVIFKRSDLAQYLALQKLGNNQVGSEVEIPDFSKLDITLFGTPPSDLSKVTAIRVQVDGTALLRFVTDESSLQADLAGKSEKSVQDIITHYPSIDKASSIIRPFWKSSFPTDPTKIKIEEHN